MQPLKTQAMKTLQKKSICRYCFRVYLQTKRLLKTDNDLYDFFSRGVKYLLGENNPKERPLEVFSSL